MHEIIRKFQEQNPSKNDKEKALSKMTDDEIDAMIEACPNIQAKIFYGSFKKANKKSYK